jgi:hypothetical protein
MDIPLPNTRTPFHEHVFVGLDIFVFAVSKLRF